MTFKEQFNIRIQQLNSAEKLILINVVCFVLLTIGINQKIVDFGVLFQMIILLGNPSLFGLVLRESLFIKKS